MNHSRARFALSLLLATGLFEGALQAQSVGTTIGPNPVPPGCPLSITVSIDYPGAGSSSFCPYVVFDKDLNEVYDPGFNSFCDETQALIGPWGWVTSHWDQKDQSGQQVPPGEYWIQVNYDVGPASFHSVTVGGAESGLVLEGTPAIYDSLTGQSRNFLLCSPQDPGEAFVLLASFTANVGFPTCGGQIPLDVDALLVESLTAGSLFPGGLGTLNGNGRSTSPKFDVPENPALIGIELATAFVVLDLLGPCQVKRVSGAHTMTVVG